MFLVIVLIFEPNLLILLCKTKKQPMKATPVTDNSIKIIHSVIGELNSIIDYENYSFVDFEVMLSDLKEFDLKIHAIALDSL
jgi:hypothetical protein